MAACKKLVSVEKLNNTNNSNWIFKIENLLIKDDLHKYVVDDPLATPDCTYSKNSYKAKAIINLSIEDAQIANVKRPTNSKGNLRKI